MHIYKKKLAVTKRRGLDIFLHAYLFSLDALFPSQTSSAWEGICLGTKYFKLTYPDEQVSVVDTGPVVL